jgi:hypothetical protein
MFFVKEGDTLKCVLSKVRTVAKNTDSKKNVFGDFFDFSKSYTKVNFDPFLPKMSLF